MPSGYPILTNFTSGEMSPRLDARVDVSKYFNACKTLYNMIVHPHGGASRRNGTHFVAETKDSSKISRLIPFQFSTEQAYILECGDQYIRFYKDGGQIVSGVAAYEIATPYTTSLLSSIKYAQNADTMRIVNQSVWPQILTRTGHTAWTMASVTFVNTPSTWGAGNWPGSIGFYEQRCCYAGTPASPQSVWLSASQAYDDMSSGVLDDDPIEVTIDDGQVNAIQWIMPGRYLNLGTVEGEWVLSSGSDVDTPITPTKRKATRVSNKGSSNIQAGFISDAVIFFQKFGRKVFHLGYRYVEDKYDPSDLTIFSEHITKSGIKEWTFQKEPDNILWLCLNNGKLAGLTLNKEQEVIAWHDHQTDGYIESLAVIPTATYYQVWMIVRREINGATKRYVEYFEDDFGDNQKACWFVDCGLSYSGTAVTTVTGLDHLEGKGIVGIADGAAISDTPITVVSGSVTIPNAAASITLGLPFTSILEPMRLELPLADGTSQGRIKKIHQVVIRFYQTLGAKIGSAVGMIDTIPFRSPADLMGQPPELFSGDKVVPFAGGWDRNGYIRIQQDQPLPMTILSIMPKVTVND
uniref:Uncharacterized protein n=1 Tax=viral metagenome TaxID=1070528 RepID=A0A6M3IWH4_9ZZZZ